MGVTSSGCGCASLGQVKTRAPFGACAATTRLKCITTARGCANQRSQGLSRIAAGRMLKCTPARIPLQSTVFRKNTATGAFVSDGKISLFSVMLNLVEETKSHRLPQFVRAQFGRAQLWAPGRAGRGSVAFWMRRHQRARFCPCGERACARRPQGPGLRSCMGRVRRPIYADCDAHLIRLSTPWRICMTNVHSSLPRDHFVMHNIECPVCHFRASRPRALFAPRCCARVRPRARPLSSTGSSRPSPIAGRPNLTGTATRARGRRSHRAAPRAAPLASNREIVGRASRPPCDPLPLLLGSLS